MFLSTFARKEFLVGANNDWQTSRSKTFSVNAPLLYSQFFAIFRPPWRRHTLSHFVAITTIDRLSSSSWLRGRARPIAYPCCLPLAFRLFGRGERGAQYQALSVGG